jgi:hypothetical protein
MIEIPNLIEPLMANRYAIEVVGTEIPSYLFREFKIFNEGDELIFTTEFYETVNFCFNPNEFFKITAVKILYLDPIGSVVNELLFETKSMNYEKTASYGSDDLLTNKMRFVIGKHTTSLLIENKN